MTITRAIEKLQRIDPQAALENAVNRTIPEYEELNKAQLFAGKNKDGQDLSPTYLNDPYFKTREAAQRYSDWKDKITPNGLRTPGVPNLFINGTYYNSWQTRIAGGRIETQASYERAKSIEDKFSNDVYGLDDPNMKKYRDIVRPLIIAEEKAQFNG